MSKKILPKKRTLELINGVKSSTEESDEMQQKQDKLKTRKHQKKIEIKQDIPTKAQK
jgi:hypothetical protein